MYIHKFKYIVIRTCTVCIIIYIHLHLTFMYSILLGGEVAQPPIRMFHNVSFLEISGLNVIQKNMYLVKLEDNI